MSLFATNSVLWLSWLAYWIVAARFVSARKFTEGRWLRLLHTLPMGAGFWLIFHRGAGYFGGRLYDNLAMRGLGTALTLGGLLFTVWARIHLGKYWSGIITLKKDHQLIRTGPYQYVRHPIYTGFVTAALGSALVAGTTDAWIGFPLILLACLIKIRREEFVLTNEFGNEYRRFKNEVAALVPFVF
jgi:protein-S-isoprenylcysteine O-methyltransferase Ste14